MIWKYLKQIINKIGKNKILAFIAFLCFGYTVYFSQPYLITELFNTKQDRISKVFILVVLAVSLMMMPIINCLNNSFIQAVRKYSKEELWNSVTNKPFSYFSEQSVGAVQSYIKDVSFACRELEQTSLAVIVQMGVMLIMYTILLGIQNFAIGILYLVFFSGYMMISVWMAKHNQVNIAASLKSASKVNEYIIDYYRNIETILSSNSKQFEHKKMDKILTDEQRTFIRVQNITNQASLLQQLLIVILASSIVLLGQYLFGASESHSLSIVLILLYSVLNLSGFGVQYLAIEELLNRIRSGLHELKYGKIFPDSKKSPYLFDESKKLIVFDQISYSYKSGKSIFKNLTLSFEKNKLTALIGSNGSGKSTLFKLLSGFFQPESGKITLPFKSKPTIMYLAQDSPLFNRSFLENICYPNQSISEARVFELVQEIGLNTLIQSVEDLTSKTPGDFKNKISGGEEQKISFLRAVIGKPQVLLLDEFTSNLDEKSIAQVYRMISKYLNDKTIISIVHRTEELKFYDQIVEL